MIDYRIISSDIKASTDTTTTSGKLVLGTGLGFEVKKTHMDNECLTRSQVDTEKG